MGFSFYNMIFSIIKCFELSLSTRTRQNGENRRSIRLYIFNLDIIEKVGILISIYCNRVHHWLGNTFLWAFSVPIHRCCHLKKRSRDPDAFFVNVNKSSVPAILPEQSEPVVPSTSNVTVAMLMYLLLVTEMLLYCHPPLALCSDQARS